MTKEEAIEKLKGILEEATEFENSVCYVTEEDREPLEMAIKALEQEPIIDKIYSDIQDLRGCSFGYSDGIIDDVEDILDKYKAESEVQE